MIYSKDQDQYIRDNYRTMPYSIMAKQMGKSTDAISRHAIDTLKLKRTDEEIKQLHKLYPSPTSFTKVTAAVNKKPIGTITKRKDSSARMIEWIKIDDDLWKPLYIINWNNVNGEIPTGKVLNCKTADTLNSDVSNWFLTTRSEILKQVRMLGSEKNCKHCNSVFKPMIPQNVFCSAKCRKEFNHIRLGYNPKPCNCLQCDTEFTPKRADNLFCTRKCWYAYKNPVYQHKKALKTRSTIDCKQCQAPFEQTHGGQKYCPKCREAALYVKPKVVRVKPLKPLKQRNKRPDKTENKHIITSAFFAPAFTSPEKPMKGTEPLLPVGIEPLSPSIPEMQYKYVDKRTRSTHYFKSKERYDRFMLKLKPTQILES